MGLQREWLARPLAAHVVHVQHVLQKKWHTNCHISTIQLPNNDNGLN